MIKSDHPTITREEKSGIDNNNRTDILVRRECGMGSMEK
jgi:hypothetical protein